MARQKTQIWTEALLKDLLRRFKKMEPKQLVDRFQQPYDDIVRAYDYAVTERRLRRSQQTVRPTKNQRAYKITVYAPGYAKGVVPNSLEENEE